MADAADAADAPATQATWAGLQKAASSGQVNGEQQFVLVGGTSDRANVRTIPAGSPSTVADSAYSPAMTQQAAG